MGLGHKVDGCGAWGILGLVLDHWWVELGFGMGGCGVRLAGLSDGLWVGGSVPDMAGCGFQGVPKLVLAH